MTNQAAQTMPQVPQAFFDEFGVNADDRVMDYGRACYAAALSQTAGVADGMVMVQKHDLEWIVAHVLDECDGSGPCADLAARRVRALLAAAPAASGGEDGPQHFDGHDHEGFPGGCERFGHSSKNCPAAASVSERARASKQVHDMLIDLRAAASIGRPITGDELHELEQDILRAIEQALTQQRGCATCGGRGEIGGHVGQTAETFDYVTEPCPECTTPQPSADAVRELVKRILNWQPLTSINKADRLYQILIAAGIPFESVTDELESLLSGGSHA